MKGTLFSAIAGAVLSVATLEGATAADMPVKAAPAAVATIYNWSGLYIGAHGGYGWGDVVTTEVPASAGAFIGIGDNWTQKVRGGIYGGQIGYNWQFGATVFGIEGEFGGTSMKGTSASGGDPTGATQAIFDARWYGDIRGRFGVAYNQFLIYGTGGWAWMNARVGTFRLNQAITVDLRTTKTFDGPTFGAGVEYAFAPRWSVKAEYIGFFLKSTTIAGNTSIPTFRAWAHDPDILHTVRVGLNYNFSALVP